MSISLLELDVQMFSLDVLVVAARCTGGKLLPAVCRCLLNQEVYDLLMLDDLQDGV